MNYRRYIVPGGTYFFTVNLANRKQHLLVEYVDVLRESIRKVKTRHPFEIDAMVIMPNHLHAVWTLPEGDSNFSMRWNLIKGGFSRVLPKQDVINPSRQQKRERGIWQRRFWEHVIADADDYRNHLDYIHYNPVKHGFVDQASDWPYSSIHRYIAQGDIPVDWGVSHDFPSHTYGE